jgi:FSR family fosmidomycin resistance protein-like MFS transporter
VSNPTSPDATNDALPDTSTRLTMRFSNLGHAFTHLFTIIYATAVLYLPGVFGMPYGELLGLSSIGLILYGVAALPAGWLGDRWSQTGMMVVFFIGVGMGSITTGFAQTPTHLLLGLSAIGLFASIYHPVGIAWLIAGARKQGMTLGINGVFGSAGTAIGPVFVGVMIDWVSWRAAFIVPGAISILLGLVLAWTWKRGLIADAKADRAPQAPPERGAIIRVFFILSMTMTCSGFVYTGLTNTIPKVFELGLGSLSDGGYTQIGFFVSSVLGAAAFSSVLGGWLADRYSARAIYVAFWSLSAVSVFFMVQSTGVALLGVTLIAMVAITTFGAAENMLVARYTPFKWRSLAYGAKFVLALGVGGLTVHLAGALYDHTGSFELLYALFSLTGVLAVISAMMLPKAGAQSAPAAPEPAQAQA